MANVFLFLSLVIISISLCGWSFIQGINLKGDLIIHNNQYHDALWHIALQQSLKQSIPPENPIFSGNILTGYHYTTDMLLNALSIILNINTFDLYLKFSPIFLSLLLTLTTYKLFLKLFKDKYISLLGTILVLLGSGFAYIINGHQSIFWLDQPIIWLTNQQLTLSIIVINLIIFFILSNLKKSWLIVGILIGLLTGIKIYALVIILPAFSLFALLTYIKEKNIYYIYSLFIAITISLLTILFVGSNNKFPFLFQPGWFIKTMYEVSDRLNNPEWELKRQTYSLHQNLPRLGLLWAEGLFIFLVGNYGLKIFSLIFIAKKPDKFILFLFSMIILSILIPLLFIQKGVVWNSIQFMHYAQIPLSILLITGLKKYLSLTKLKVILLLLILISLPTTLKEITGFFNIKNYVTFNKQSLTLIDSINKLPKQSVIIIGSDYNQTSLVPALSKRSVYFADPIINDILLINYQERRTRIKMLEQNKTGCLENEFLFYESIIYKCVDKKLLPIL